MWSVLKAKFTVSPDSMSFADLTLGTAPGPLVKLLGVAVAVLCQDRGQL